MDWCSSVAYPHTGGSCALSLYGPMLLRDSLSSQTDSLLTNYARQYTCDMLETNEVKPSDNGGSRGLVVKVLDSKFEGCQFKTHTGHGSFSKLRQFRLPYFASVYSAANEYKHCLEGTCDGLVSRPGESV